VLPAGMLTEVPPFTLVAGVPDSICLRRCCAENASNNKMQQPTTKTSVIEIQLTSLPSSRLFFLCHRIANYASKNFSSVLAILKARTRTNRIMPNKTVLATK
jgi:hypothetical protein